jgi:hypothetical protein
MGTERRSVVYDAEGGDDHERQGTYVNHQDYLHRTNSIVRCGFHTSFMLDRSA